MLTDGGAARCAFAHLTQLVAPLRHARLS